MKYGDVMKWNENYVSMIYRTEDGTGWCEYQNFGTVLLFYSKLVEKK